MIATKFPTNIKTIAHHNRGKKRRGGFQPVNSVSAEYRLSGARSNEVWEVDNVGADSMGVGNI